jgi:hypothetical protein
LIGKFEGNALLIGLLYISLSLFGDSIINSQKSFCVKNSNTRWQKLKAILHILTSCDFQRFTEANPITRT